MAGEKDILTGKDPVTEEWERMNFSGEIKPLDRSILKVLWSHPEWNHSQIATCIGVSTEVIQRRLAKPSVVKARMLIEGTVSDLMGAAAHKFAKWINKTLVHSDAEYMDQREVSRGGSEGAYCTAHSYGC
jgi:hypothetical protein